VRLEHALRCKGDAPRSHANAKCINLTIKMFCLLIDRSPHRSPPSLPPCLPSHPKKADECLHWSNVLVEYANGVHGTLPDPDTRYRMCLHLFSDRAVPEHPVPFTFRFCRAASAYISPPPTLACGVGALQTPPHASCSRPLQAGVLL
jgi:hypothetical protein